MLKIVSEILKFAIPLLMGIGLFIYVYRDTDIKILLDHLSRIEYQWVLLSMLISLLAFYLRAYRWKLLLETMGYHLKIFNVLIALFIGFFANLLFPRLGEITRCGYLKKTDNVEISEAFGTVISERIVDLVSFGVLGFVTLLIEWDVFQTIFGNLIGQYESGPIRDKIILFSCLIIVICIIIFVAYKVKKVRVFILGLVRGLLSVIQLKRRNAFILSTIGIWIVYYLMVYVLFFSMESTALLSPVVGMSVLVAGTLGMIVPVQSGIGTYHFFVSAILVYYGVNGYENEVIPLVSHGSQTVVVLIFGLLSLIASFFITKSNPHDSIKNTQ